ncbi:MAG: hypothetical protein IJI57_04205 [Flexilinea sp.]|nr:hypothetical protein [Flexilinea sp.]
METIRICRDKNVLKEYLKNEEVANIMFGYFDKEYQLELLRNKEREEGREEGLEQGFEQGELLMLVNLAEKKTITIEQAAEEAGMSVDEFLEKMRIV